MSFERQTAMREVAERALRYRRESHARESFATSVISACATMLFRATPAEEQELVNIVRNAATRR